MLPESYYVKYLKASKAKRHVMMREQQEPEPLPCTAKFRLKFGLHFLDYNSQDQQKFASQEENLPPSVFYQKDLCHEIPEIKNTVHLSLHL